jgi:hypothetical protein
MIWLILSRSSLISRHCSALAILIRTSNEFLNRYRSRAEVSSGIASTRASIISCEVITSIASLIVKVGFVKLLFTCVNQRIYYLFLLKTLIDLPSSYTVWIGSTMCGITRLIFLFSLIYPPIAERITALQVCFLLNLLALLDGK